MEFIVVAAEGLEPTTLPIYRRYAIADEAMLKEGAARLAALHAREATAENKVVALKKGAE